MTTSEFDVTINSFDDVINAVKKAIDDVKLEEISQPSFCTLLDTYFREIDKVKQQICGATPKRVGAYKWTT